MKLFIIVVFIWLLVSIGSRLQSVMGKSLADDDLPAELVAFLVRILLVVWAAILLF